MNPGFHAKDLNEFVDKLQMILSLDEEEQLSIRKAARTRAVEVFSNQAFCQSWELYFWSRLHSSKMSKKNQ